MRSHQRDDRPGDFSDHPPSGRGRDCRRCNYDLTGLPCPGTCPECGTRFGNELVIEGMQKKRESLASIITTFILMFMFAAVVSYFERDGFCCGLSLLLIASLTLISKLLKERTRRELGYDLRWVIDEEGIRVIRGRKGQIPLLTWSGIKDVRVRRSLGPFTPDWSRITIRRSLHSMDMVRVRGQDIWISGLREEDRRRLRESILEYRKRAET